MIKVNKYTRRETGGPVLHTNYTISLRERRHPDLVVLLLPFKCPIKCVMFDVGATGTSRTGLFVALLNDSAG